MLSASEYSNPLIDLSMSFTLGHGACYTQVQFGD